MSKHKSTRDEAAKQLKGLLQEINGMCRPEQRPLALHKSTIWPSITVLGDLWRYIYRLASLYNRHVGPMWSCILAVENRRPRLNLQKRIEDMVDRASKLYRHWPHALDEIRKEAKEGNVAAKACFEDLQKCAWGKSEMASVDWEQYRIILAPAEGETCREKAAQICIDGLRWHHETGEPTLGLMLWLVGTGYPALGKKFRCDLANAGGEIPEMQRKRRRTELAALRQKKRRLKSRERKLVQEGPRRIAKISRQKSVTLSL